MTALIIVPVIGALFLIMTPRHAWLTGTGLFVTVAVWIIIWNFWNPDSPQSPETPGEAVPTSQGISTQNQTGGSNWVNNGTVIIGADKGNAASDPTIKIEPNAATSTDQFTDTKFLISNQSNKTIYDVGYSVECWDGDLVAFGNPRVRNYFTCYDKVPSLSGGATMSARFQFGTVRDPKSGQLIEPLLISRPICQVYVNYSLDPKSSDRKETGRIFWAQRNSARVFVWTPAGDAVDFKATDEWPQLTPQ